MKKTGLFFVLVSFLLTGTSLVAQNKEHPGQKIFTESKCQTCHTVESHDLTSKSKKAVDLSNVGAVYRANFLEKFLAKKEKIDGKSHPQAFKGSNEELNQLAEWLQTLNTGEKTTETKGKSDTKTPKDTSGSE